MRALTLPPSESGVTRVTRVTPLAKCPDSLAFTPVTQFSSLTYMRCNAAIACNAKVITRLLWASGLNMRLQNGFRWLLALSAGRGTLRYTVPMTLRDD
jgi:hypothetical protein